MAGDDDVEYVLGPETHRTESGAIVSYRIMRVPASDAYPSGWNYSLHLGDGDGNTVVRYDNAHEDVKGTNDTPVMDQMTTRKSSFRACPNYTNDFDGR